MKISTAATPRGASGPTGPVSTPAAKPSKKRSASASSTSSRKKNENKKKTKSSSSSSSTAILNTSSPSKKRKSNSSSSSSSSGKRGSSSSLEATGSTNIASNNKYIAPLPVPPDDYESDPETSLYIPPDDDSSKCNINYNRCMGCVHWDPNSINGSKVGYRIRVYDFDAGVSRKDSSNSSNNSSNNRSKHSKKSKKSKHTKKSQTQSQLQTSGWKHGRIVRYDPISHKHKVVFFGRDGTDADENDMEEEQEEAWLTLANENVQIGGEFVWALVKGFAWWPAQVLHCHFGRSQRDQHGGVGSKSGSGSATTGADVGGTTPKTSTSSAGDTYTNSNNSVNAQAGISPVKVKNMTTQPVREGYELVEFFDSDEVASIKKTPDFLRPFRRGTVDEVIAKNKKKRNERAWESGVQEEVATQEVRNDAARFYAECAFHCANRRANYYLGMRVEIFRSDINYPVGAKLVGTVRQYSLTTKKWLVAYDPPPANKEQYVPSWIQLTNKSVTYKVIDDLKGPKRKLYQPNELDIFPFLFGYKDQNGTVGTKCRGCVAECDFENETVIQCAECTGNYHPGCLDPPMSTRTAENILKNREKWVCNKCIRCVGCRELEIVFGTKTVSQPSSLFLEDDCALKLCNSCIPMYEKDMYCPTCAHIWDDTRFQRIQKRVQRVRKSIGNVKDNFQCQVVPADDDKKDSIFRWKSPRSIDDSWFYPEEMDAWGYNEGAMIFCENCNLWVHAGCAELSKSEYSLTNEGKHPIYSKEFLCRTCCKRKCLSLVNLLKDNDNMGLFAEPVTDKVAHNYSDIIKNPMDLQTMAQRAQEGEYRNYSWLRESFELMVCNALTFNIGYTTYWNEAKRFYKVCTEKVFEPEGKGAPPSMYVEKIQERFKIADEAVQAEKDRIKADETTEKKDLIAGSQVLKVKLGPLEKPIDPPSCVTGFELRLSPTEALYCAWMECCFTCGSSGAADTMLFCVDCGEGYHSFCAMAPIHSMNEAAVSGWRCPNCKLCEITGEVTDDETKLLYCEMCDRAFSMDRIEPPLSKVPSGLWICGQCVDCVECENRHYNGVVSRAFWSKDPSICRGCGGGEKELKPKVKVEVKVKEVVAKPKVNVKVKKQAKEAMKPLKVKKKAKEDIKPKITKQPKVVIVKPKKSKEELKEEALVHAMNEAKSRGLPDGWTCFYGAANRKRWRSPPPNERVFDSIPKALLFVEKLKNGTSPALKQKSRAQRPMSYVRPFILFELNLDEEQEWVDREMGYDDNTSLMSDAECLLRILEPKVGVHFCELFDPSAKTISNSEELRELPRWIFQRAARFVRFFKRLSKRSQKQKDKRGIDRASQIVVCKMASAFVYVICRIFKIGIRETIKSHSKMESLLIPIDPMSGTVALSLPIKKHRIHRKGGRYEYKCAMGKGKYDYTPSAVTEQENQNAMPVQDCESTSSPLKLTETAPVVPKPLETSTTFAQNYKSTTEPSAQISLLTTTCSSISPGKGNPNSNISEGITVETQQQGNHSTHTTSGFKNTFPIDTSNNKANDAIGLTTSSENNTVVMLDNGTAVTIPLNLGLDGEAISADQNLFVGSLPITTHNANTLVDKRTTAYHREDQGNIEASIDILPNGKATQHNGHGSLPAHQNTSNIDEVESPQRQSLTVGSPDSKPTVNIANSPINESPREDGDPEVKRSMSAQDYDIANVLLGLTSPGRSGPNVSIQIVREDQHKISVEQVKENIIDEITLDNSELNVLDKNDEVKIEENLVDETRIEAKTGEDTVAVTSTELKAEEDTVGETIIELKAEEDTVEEATTENIEENIMDEEYIVGKRDENAVDLPWLTLSHIKVEPMLGWPLPSKPGSGTVREWKDPRVCCLCLTCGDDDAGLEPLDHDKAHSAEESDINLDQSHGAGRLLPLPNGGWVHANCAVWSSEVWETPNGGYLNDVSKARGRSSKLKCFGCGRSGATLGCHKGNCVKNYHFACARACGVVFMENHKLYCRDHKACAKDGALRTDFSEPMKSLKIGGQNDTKAFVNQCLRLGSLVVHSVGKIQTDIDGFHNRYYIMPPGYTSTRIFWSFVKPKTRTLYFMKIERSSLNLPLFLLTAADAPSKTFQGDDVKKVYREVMEKVWEMNKEYFSHGDLFSVFPMQRSRKQGRNAFCLNGPQFWGFGIDNVRKYLETLPGAVACAVPLTEKSTPYRFCFHNPTENSVTDLQRKRAALEAEKALENSSGCARTEGMSAVDKSTSSGRITRALVGKGDQDQSSPTKSKANVREVLNDSSKQNFESNQAKYKEMKKYPMEQRLAAKRSHIHGWGLFAKRKFPKHSMIAEYMGETIGQTIADKREKKYEVLGMGSCYMFRLDWHNIVDATNIGCMARFMNHCCAANAYAKVISVNTSLGLEKKIVVFANQDIEKGDEITYDYKFPVEDGSLRCTCGAPNCIGRMN